MPNKKYNILRHHLENNQQTLIVSWTCDSCWQLSEQLTPPYCHLAVRYSLIFFIITNGQRKRSLS